jgi:peroxiredoxin
LPDGSGEFAKGMDMLVKKDNLGFGERSWLYSMFVDNREIKQMFVEEEEMR